MLSALKIPGYYITEVVHEGLMTIIYRCVSQAQGQPFIFKCLLAEYPTQEWIAKLKHEYQIQLLLNHPGIVKVIDYLNFGNCQGLLLEDFGGQSLEQHLQTKQLDVITCLNIAIQLAKALDYLHKNQIIHKDIKPSNIIINTSIGIVKLTDFSISSPVNKENLQFSNPNFIQGTLNYISPEQTGRMNRILDYRTDFYSLGVTLYEMLTRKLPYESNDPSEIIYSHIAREPLPPNQINSDVPAAISEIIMKLMAKNAEDRYQSAVGLLADLEICYNRLKASCELNDFIPGRLDILSQLVIPQKLYGREDFVLKLLDAFERVCQGNTEMVLVSGHSGVGKSALVHEIHKPITRVHGYFISGKFDQFKRDIPYAPLIQALTSLVQLLLTENSEQLEEWKNKITAALGVNGQVIVEIIPEIELIIGKQLPISQLAPIELQNRFHRVFQQFIRVFCHSYHPLVIFLDDLQWADSATLKLIELLVADYNLKYMLFIGAYRDNEVSQTHLLMQTQEQLKKSGITINYILLQGISLENVCQLVANTLKDFDKRTYPLGKLIFNKANGNPFFITQLLQVLFQEKLLIFNFNQQVWEWDIEIIETFSITDASLLELIISRIEKLPQATQEVLKLAACIGNQFSLKLLSTISDKFPSQTVTELNLALQQGLVFSLSESSHLLLNNELSVSKEINYKFMHDRVQQAAYSLISDQQKQAVHLKIGRILRVLTLSEKLSDKILDIVNQLNLSIELLVNQAEKNELAQFNLAAGKKAKNSAAYQAASSYFNVGLRLLPLDCWQSNYDLALNLYVETAEAEYLNGNFDRSKELAKIALQQAKTVLDRVRVYTIKIQTNILQNRVSEALDEGIEALKLLRIRLPNQPTILHLTRALVQTKLALFGKNIKDLTKLPCMIDPYILAATQILMLIIPAAAMTGSKIFPLVLLTIVNLSIKYGNCAASSYAYTLYGAILCTYGDIDTGYEFGCVGLNILESINTNSLKCKVFNLFYTMIWHFKNSVQSMITPTLETVQIGLETGDIEYVGYSALSLSSNLFLNGECLEKVTQQSSEFVQLLQNIQLKTVAETTSNISEISRALQLPYICLTELVAGNDKQLDNLGNNRIFLSFIYVTNTLVNYLFNNYQKAIEYARTVENFQKGNPGFFIYPVNNFYYSLSLLANYKNASLVNQLLYLKKIASNQKKMRLWARHAPCNFQHKYELVEAEKARVFGQYIKAMHLYDKAITGAAKNNYIQEVALANELAAKFYLALGSYNIAKIYLSEAHYNYARWGARSKVKDLEERYPYLITRTRQSSNTTITFSTNSTTYGKCLLLDISTIVKASQALSSEIVLERLLEKLMHLVKENAGAQKVVFIAKRSSELVVEASLTEQEMHITQQEIEIVPLSLISYVERTQTHVLLDDAQKSDNFKNDPYIAVNQPKSILAYPIIYSSKLIGILYLENNLTTKAFTQDRLEVLQILSVQAAISLENASFYSTLELRVKERTQQLEEKNQELQTTLKQLRLTQAQLIQNEKMSSLGQLIAGIAHEINNPITFIYGNLTHLSEYTQSLLELLCIYQEEYPYTKMKITDKIKECDIDFIKDDLPNLLSSICSGASRVRDIVISLRNFSRLDEAAIKQVDIHEGIEGTIMILQHRMEKIQVLKEYGNLPLVKCYANQLNQVFLNLLTNSIDALFEQDLKNQITNTQPVGSEAITGENLPRGYSVWQSSDVLFYPSKLALPSVQKPTIWIYTEVDNKNQIVVRITDNGVGITDEVKNKIFDPFFTTKPVGKGTGLGLSISYQIVTEKHKGTLECISSPGKGTTFVIRIPQNLDH